MLIYATYKPREKFQLKTTDEDSYNVLKQELDDAVFDVRTIGDLDIFFDDEFLLKENKELIPTVIIKNSKGEFLTNHDIIICGNVVFVSHDETGETISLTGEAYQTLAYKFNFAMVGEHRVMIYQNY